VKTKTFLPLYLTVFAFCQSVSGQSPPQSSPGPASGSPAQVQAVAEPLSEEKTSLDLVIGAVTNALQKYQDNLGGGADALPRLKSAEFNFNVVTSQKTGGAINLFILKFGGSVEKSTTNEVAYNYAVPGQAPKLLEPRARPQV
jgi:hypothetical protein